jgi:uncharacterized RDD family membrane protein YckC
MAVFVISLLLRLAVPAWRDFGVGPPALVLVGVTAIYEIGFIAWFGQTIGKWLLGIAVVDPSGTNPRLGHSTVRYVVKSLQPALGIIDWVAAPAPAAGLVAMTYLGWQIALLRSISNAGSRQGYHDRAANTYVVNVTVRKPWSARLSGRGAPPAPLAALPGRVRKRRISARR